MNVDSFLEHHGVKGMHWGIRRKRGSNGRVGSPSGGKPRPKAHELSDEELKKALSRMQMEKQYNQLLGVDKKTPSGAGMKAAAAGAAFVSGIALNIARTQIQNQANAKIADALKKRAEAPKSNKNIRRLQRLSKK